MNFIRVIYNNLIKLFMPHEPRQIIDETKVEIEKFETEDPSDIEDLPKEMIPEPFYSIFNEDLVETLPSLPDQLPTAQELLEQPQLVDKAMGISIPRLNEDTVL